MMKMPPKVTASIPKMKPGAAPSPPIVPGSSVRSIDIHSRSGIGRSSSPPIRTRTSVIPTMISREITPSPAISAIVPSSMNRSNR